MKTQLNHQAIFSILFLVFLLSGIALIAYFGYSQEEKQVTTVQYNYEYRSVYK